MKNSEMIIRLVQLLAVYGDKEVVIAKPGKKGEHIFTILENDETFNIATIELEEDG